jgi:hypothetical protein
MKPSKHGEYALRALIDLGIASELGRPMPSNPVSDRSWGLKEIQNNSCIPTNLVGYQAISIPVDIKLPTEGVA